MKVLALHDNEQLATLLTTLSAITEVKVVSVRNVSEFQNFLTTAKFDAVIVLFKFFEQAMAVLLKDKNYPKAVTILVENDEQLDRLLALGPTDGNIENITFNPLTFFIKLKLLRNILEEIEKELKEKKEEKKLDYFRYGLFNILNLLTKTTINTYLSIKDAKTGEVFYILNIRDGQVIASDKTIEEIIEVNKDDSIPKIVSTEPVIFTEKTIFRNTADFYKSLISTEVKEEVIVPIKLKERLEINFLAKENVNLFRKRLILSFNYKDWTILSQLPTKDIGPYLGNRTAVVITKLDAQDEVNIKIQHSKYPDLKFLTSKAIKEYLTYRGIPEENFLDLEKVEIIDYPFLGSKLECFVFFPNGVLITGNLFGSYYSKDVLYLDDVLASHLRVFHKANITSTERLKRALEILEPYKSSISYILPGYGYVVDSTALNYVWILLSKLELPAEFSTLANNWKKLTESYEIKTDSYKAFLNSLEKGNHALIFNIIDAMDMLDIVPVEF